MTTKKTSKPTDFLTKALKNDLKTIVSDVVNKNKSLTSSDLDILTIKKTNNGYVLDFNDGTPTEPPTVEVIQTDDMDGTEDPELYREGLLDLLYNVAMWSGYEYNPKGEHNLNIGWDLPGEELVGDNSEKGDEDLEGDFVPPTKEQILAAARGDEIETEFDNEADMMENPIVSEDELNDNEWVAGDDYGSDEDDSDEDEGYNEEEFIEED